MKNGTPINVEYRARDADGGWRWMRSRGAPRFNTAGKIVCWYGSVEDIDALKRVEEALTEIQALLPPSPYASLNAS